MVLVSDKTTLSYRDIRERMPWNGFATTIFSIRNIRRGKQKSNTYLSVVAAVVRITGYGHEVWRNRRSCVGGAVSLKGQRPRWLPPDLPVEHAAVRTNTTTLSVSHQP